MSKATLFDSRIKKYAYCKPPEICRDLGTSALGLSKEQVDTMREKYGKNRHLPGAGFHCGRYHYPAIAASVY